MFDDSSQDLASRLRRDLLNARKSRDQLTSTTLQEAISALDNAGAVPISRTIGTIGVGSTEVPRRELSTQDAERIITREIIELQQAIKELGNMQSPYVDELSSKITILEKYVSA